MTFEEQIVQVLEETRDAIRKNMEEKGINASGRTSLSFRVRKVGDNIQLVSGGDSQAWGGRTAPSESLELGRAPGGDWHELRPRIVQWTREKGLNFQDDSHRWAVSTIIAKNITERGTRRYSQHEDVYSTPVNEAFGKLQELLKASIQGTLHEAIKSTHIIKGKTNL